MYQILDDNGALIIAEAADSRNAIRVDGLSSLLRLRTRIEQYLLDQKVDDVSNGDHPLSVGKYIDSVDARRLAAEHGAKLPSSTLVTACAAGSIDGAEKRGGRWWMPTDSFLRWLNRRDRSV